MHVHLAAAAAVRNIRLLVQRFPVAHDGSQNWQLQPQQHQEVTTFGSRGGGFAFASRNLRGFFSLCFNSRYEAVFYLFALHLHAYVRRCTVRTCGFIYLSLASRDNDCETHIACPELCDLSAELAEPKSSSGKLRKNRFFSHFLDEIARAIFFFLRAARF